MIGRVARRPAGIFITCPVTECKTVAVLTSNPIMTMICNPMRSDGHQHDTNGGSADFACTRGHSGRVGILGNPCPIYDCPYASSAEHAWISQQLNQHPDVRQQLTKMRQRCKDAELSGRMLADREWDRTQRLQKRREARTRVLALCVLVVGLFLLGLATKSIVWGFLLIVVITAYTIEYGDEFFDAIGDVLLDEYKRD